MGVLNVLSLLSVLNVLSLLSVLNVLKVLDVLDILNVLNMPKDASLAYGRIVWQRFFGGLIGNGNSFSLHHF